MDPNSPGPAPTPEQPTPEAPQRLQQAPQVPQQAPQPLQNEQQPIGAPQQPVPNGQPPKKMSKGVIFAIIGGILFIILLIVGIIAFNAMTGKDTADSNNRNDSSKQDTTDKEDTPATKEAITAKALVDLRTACVGGSAVNAAAFTKPYSYVIFENNNYGDGEKEEYKWDMAALASNDENSSLNEKSDPSELNVVVCLDRDDTTAVKTMTCELRPSAGMEEGASTVADYHSVEYKVALYEARSGMKIKELAPINGPATECPAVKYYNQDSPAIYGDPDLTELDAELKAFEQ